MSSELLQLLADYLAPRTAYVIVNGTASYAFTLQNMVYQGTVLGPSLWNVFFADVRNAAESTGGHEAKFADDLNIYKLYSLSSTADQIFADLHVCQNNVHNWGAANRVTFDPGKEEFCILHPADGIGNDFKLLGPIFDCKLTMAVTISKILRKARPKLTTLLRTGRYYNTRELVRQFKTHVLNILESSNGAIYHATATVLAPLDHVADSFIRDVGLTRETALLEYNLAPTELRRDIGMLGFLHKAALKQAHDDILALFPHAPDQAQRMHNTRLANRRHDRQLLDRVRGFSDKICLDIFTRSIFGLVRVYNLLPQHWVSAKTVSSFQRLLTNAAKEACQRNIAGWESMFSPRVIPIKCLWTRLA